MRDDLEKNFHMLTFDLRGIGRSEIRGRKFRVKDLAYIEDQGGATFFEYDAFGRIRMEVRHRGPLSAFSEGNLTATETRFNVHARPDAAQEGCHSAGNSGIPPSKAILAA
ncbi:MAG: hypothetical protein GY822_04370 [Deltaproteobacteria bacterium]|nr:hypothetical protein [Deltaproteobacteria bacterium]